MRRQTSSRRARTSPVLVSACLLGLPTRYNGKRLKPALAPESPGRKTLIPVCPEQLGGLATPRPPQSLHGGDGAAVLEGRAGVVTASGRDVTAHFLRGAKAVCKLARLLGAAQAVLKDGSPSCGVTRVTIDGKKTRGMGVTAAALARLGVTLDTVRPHRPQPRRTRP